MLVFVFLFLLDLGNVVGVTHSLKYFYTASSWIPNFPSYVSVGFVDDVQISYCDSETNENIPKQEWMNKVSSDYPNYWKEETQTCLAKQQTFKKNLEISKQLYNQTEGVPVFQQMYGCEWDDETGKVKGYDQFGYDGEDLIALDLESQSWITPKPQAFITKQKWENDRVAQYHEKSYLTLTCVEWLMKYVSYGRSSLTKTVLPSVSLLQKNSSSPVCCLATGFYPNRTEMFWRKDGQEIHDGVVKEEILPNNDGTFQMSIYANLSFVPSDDWAKYECVFQFSGFKENIVTRLERRKIRTKEVNSSTSHITVIVVVIVAVMIVALVIAVTIFLYQRMKKVPQYSVTETSSSSSTSRDSVTETSSSTSRDSAPPDREKLRPGERRVDMTY